VLNNNSLALSIANLPQLLPPLSFKMLYRINLTVVKKLKLIVRRLKWHTDKEIWSRLIYRIIYWEITPYLILSNKKQLVSFPSVYLLMDQQFIDFELISSHQNVSIDDILYKLNICWLGAKQQLFCIKFLQSRMQGERHRLSTADPLVYLLHWHFKLELKGNIGFHVKIEKCFVLNNR
jgi:hypothetical protein